MDGIGASIGTLARLIIILIGLPIYLGIVIYRKIKKIKDIWLLDWIIIG